MARYADDYEGRTGAWYGRGYDADLRRSRGYDRRGGAYYGEEIRWAARRGRLPRKPAHGFPVRGIHTYDLDYGAMGGPTTEYSGRTGYPVLQPRPEPIEELPSRGPYTPILEEADRDRTLYGGVPPGYRAREERYPRRRRYRRETG
jgi:hypothetical protein